MKTDNSKCRDNELFFYEIVFEGSSARYNYLADANEYAVGDIVVVPVGLSNTEAIGRIASINHFSPEQAPYPVEKTKHILRKAEAKHTAESVTESEEKEYVSFMDLSYQKQYEAFFYPICAFLEKHHIDYIVHTAKEKEYAYLYNDEYCCYIEIINPYRNEIHYGVEIEDEIILFYNRSHQHIDIYENDDLDNVVAGLLKTLEGIIENRLAGYILLCGDGWLYGGDADLARLAADIEDPFASADANLSEPEFEIKLRSLGGKHSYTFWNPIFDRVISIPKREYTYFYYQISRDGRCSKESFISVNDAQAQNVVLIYTENKYGPKYSKQHLTNSRAAVDSIVQIIRRNPCIMDYDDEHLWKDEKGESSSRNAVFNSIHFGDGVRENTIGEFGLWDYCNSAEGTLKTVFEVYYEIRDVLISEGIPEEFFADM